MKRGVRPGRDLHTSGRRFDTVRAHQSLRRSEELQCDAVGIPGAQARPVRGVHDSAVLDPGALQPLDPGLQLGATRAPESDVVQPGLKLGETLIACGSVVLMETPQPAVAQCPTQMSDPPVGAPTSPRLGTNP